MSYSHIPLWCFDADANSSSVIGAAVDAVLSYRDLNVCKVKSMTLNALTADALMPMVRKGTWCVRYLSPLCPC